jgi:glycosyltransferase involved in cell wall biosynthesis
MESQDLHIPRIFHGPVNICGIGRSIADWQREKKKATSDFIVFTDRTPFQDSHQNLHFEQKSAVARIIGKLKFFACAVNDYDIFHFYFGKTLLPLSIDLPILRLLGKKIIMHYVGSDIRLYALHSKNNPYYHLRKAKSIWDHFDLAKRARMIWQGVWFHVCFAELTLYPHARTSIPLRKINHTLWINKARSVPSTPPKPTKRTNPSVIHAPTDVHTKGTPFIEKAVEELKHEGLQFQFHIYSGKPHDELMEILQTDADIVIDQLFSGGFGVFAMEAMSFGRPVCSFILPEIREQIPDLPIVQCTVDTLKTNLRDLIMDGEKRDRIGYEGWQFAQKHFDQDKIYEELWQIYLKLMKQ